MKQAESGQRLVAFSCELPHEKKLSDFLRRVVFTVKL
jgi:hypothetical protein